MINENGPTGYLEVGHNAHGEIVINHPDLVFSLAQARELSNLLLKQIRESEQEAIDRREQAKRDAAAAIPVDRSARVLTDGSPVEQAITTQGAQIMTAFDDEQAALTKLDADIDADIAAGQSAATAASTATPVCTHCGHIEPHNVGTLRCCSHAHLVGPFWQRDCACDHDSRTDAVPALPVLEGLDELLQMTVVPNALREARAFIKKLRAQLHQMQEENTKLRAESADPSGDVYEAWTRIAKQADEAEVAAQGFTHVPSRTVLMDLIHRLTRMVNQKSACEDAPGATNSVGRPPGRLSS